MHILSVPPTLRQASAWLLAGITHAAGLAALVLYLALPDVRPYAERFPERTAFMRLRAAEPGGAPIRTEPVALERIDSTLVRAVLVSEDAAFYQHRGVDWHELGQAVLEAWRESGRIRGASTLTQQLARNLYLSPERSLGRKLVELFIARRLERDLSKRRILELYLNVAEWGPGLFGVEAAARAYYGVPAASLTPSQAAGLAATLPHPLTANPRVNSDRLQWRAALILERLRARGWLAAADRARVDTVALLDSLAVLDSSLAALDSLARVDTPAPLDTLAPPDTFPAIQTRPPPETVPEIDTLPAPDTARG